MLAVINIYQSAVYFISLIVFIRTFINTFKNNENLSLAFFSLIFIGFTSFIIYSNIYMLVKKKINRDFLTINIWFNFFQIFYLSLIGFTYYVLIGIQIIPYFIYKQDWDIRFFFSFYRVSLDISYKSSDAIFFGISVVPMIICIMLSRI